MFRIWILIRIGTVPYRTVFIWVFESSSGSMQEKWLKKTRKVKDVFSEVPDVPFWELDASTLAWNPSSWPSNENRYIVIFYFKKNKILYFFHWGKVFLIFGHPGLELDPDQDSPKSLNPDMDSMKMDPDSDSMNMGPQH